MKQELNTEAAETDQIGSSPAVAQERLVRQFSQAGYIIVHPAKDDSGLPLIEKFHLTAWEAEERAKSLISAYSHATYPHGLIVVPCKVLFDMPNR